MNVLKIAVYTLFFLSMPINALSHKQSAVNTTDQMIIKYKDDKILNDINIIYLIKDIKTNESLDINMKILRHTSSNENIVKVSINGVKPSLDEMKYLAKELTKYIYIEYAEPDYIMKTMILP